jgi:hypothetical protein
MYSSAGQTSQGRQQTYSATPRIENHRVIFNTPPQAPRKNMNNSRTIHYNSYTRDLQLDLENFTDSDTDIPSVPTLNRRLTMSVSGERLPSYDMEDNDINIDIINELLENKTPSLNRNPIMFTNYDFVGEDINDSDDDDDEIERYNLSTNTTTCYATECNLDTMSQLSQMT